MTWFALFPYVDRWIPNTKGQYCGKRFLSWRHHVEANFRWPWEHLIGRAWDGDYISKLVTNNYSLANWKLLPCKTLWLLMLQSEINLHTLPGQFYNAWYIYPDSKVHGVNMGPTWGRQDPGAPHVGHEPCYLGMLPCISARCCIVELSDSVIFSHHIFIHIAGKYASHVMIPCVWPGYRCYVNKSLFMNRRITDNDWWLMTIIAESWQCRPCSKLAGANISASTFIIWCPFTNNFPTNLNSVPLGCDFILAF